MLGLDFQVMVSTFEENTSRHALSPGELVINLARGKAEDVFKLTSSQVETSDALVLAADTIVVADGEYLGKPCDENEARKMLSFLSGKWHWVYTGVALVHKTKSTFAYEMTKVHFRTLDAEEIDGYIWTGEPMDKAGAYGIQGVGAVLVDRIEGCFYNVMGLPLSRLALLLKDYGFRIPEVKSVVRTIDQKSSFGRTPP